ncbi:hypothetical protein AQ610_05740 [Burkholderia humptydooensis]|nr:hypothetical protein AQ610_05740 [Burkholderia humptydooensis]
MEITPASADFIGELVSYVCDANKPVTQTQVLDGTAVRVTCVFRDNGIPQYVQGVHMQVVR